MSDAKIAHQEGVPREQLWRVALHLEELRLFGTPQVATELHDDFTASIWNAGDPVGFWAIINFSGTVTKKARQDLRI